MSFNYEDNNPIVHVKLTINDKELDVPAYADTGCSSAIVITKKTRRYLWFERTRF